MRALRYADLNTLNTCPAVQLPPRAAVMPRSFSFAAIPNSE
jgi:hypothetical protein